MGSKICSQISLSIHVGPSTTINDVFIRGIGSGKTPTFDAEAPTFIDDIYFGRSKGTVATFLDVNNVEVLKGPQSTYFGNSAVAGAINIVTNTPGSTFSGSARTLYGSYGQYAAELEAGGPLTDTLGIRVALIAAGQTGWLYAPYTNTHVPDFNELAGRVTLVFKPNDDFDATLRLWEDNFTNPGGFGLQQYNCPPPAPFAKAQYCATQVNTYGITSQSLRSNIVYYAPGDNTSYDQNGAALTLNYQHWGLTFTSVTGFYSQHDYLDLDEDLIPLAVPLLSATVPEDYNQFSQEFRVASPADQKITYLANLPDGSLPIRRNAIGSYGVFNSNFLAIPALAPYVPISAYTSRSVRIPTPRSAR